MITNVTQVNHNRPWRSNSLTPPTPRNCDEFTMSPGDMISNSGIWSSPGNPNYKLRSHSLTILKNGQIKDEVRESMNIFIFLLPSITFNLDVTVLNYNFRTVHFRAKIKFLLQFAITVGK